MSKKVFRDTAEVSSPHVSYLDDSSLSGVNKNENGMSTSTFNQSVPCESNQENNLNYNNKSDNDIGHETNEEKYLTEKKETTRLRGILSTPIGKANEILEDRGEKLHKEKRCILKNGISTEYSIAHEEEQYKSTNDTEDTIFFHETVHKLPGKKEGFIENDYNEVLDSLKANFQIKSTISLSNETRASDISPSVQASPSTSSYLDEIINHKSDINENLSEGREIKDFTKVSNDNINLDNLQYEYLSSKNSLDRKHDKLQPILVDEDGIERIENIFVSADQRKQLPTTLQWKDRTEADIESNKDDFILTESVLDRQFKHPSEDKSTSFYGLNNHQINHPSQMNDENYRLLANPSIYQNIENHSSDIRASRVYPSFIPSGILNVNNNHKNHHFIHKQCSNTSFDRKYDVTNFHGSPGSSTVSTNTVNNNHRRHSKMGNILSIKKDTSQPFSAVSTPAPPEHGATSGHSNNPSPESSQHVSIIKSYANIGDEKGAEEALSNLLKCNVRPDVVLYNSLLSAYATNGNYQGAENLLVRMRKEANISPNVVTYSSLINAYANKGQAVEAENVINRMNSDGIDPNVITYNSLISAYAKDGNYQGAASVLQRMLESTHVQPNVTTYNSVINAYANKGNYQGAEEMVKKMHKNRIDPNMTTFNSLIDAYANRGNWEGAEDVLNRMINFKGLEPNVITYSSVINAYANKGHWAGAESVLQRMRQRSISPNIITFNSLITAYAKEGSWQGAEDVLTRIKADQNIEPNVTTYNLVINAYANKGHWKGAEGVLQRMIKSRTDPNVMTYNSLINAHAKDGNWRGAEDVMTQLLTRGIEPNVTTFNSLIKAYTKEGNSNGAENVLNRMKEYEKGFSVKSKSSNDKQSSYFRAHLPLQPNVTTWSSVINAYAAKGDWKGAEDVLERMQRETPPVYPNVTTYSSVINAYANVGHWQGAEDIFRRLVEKGLEADVITYNSLLKVYSNANDVNGCSRGIELVSKMIHKRQRPTHVTFKTLFSLLCKYPNLEQLRTARNLMDEHLPIKSRNAAIYSPLIELCGSLGDLQSAKGYFEEAKRTNQVDKFVLRVVKSFGLLVKDDYNNAPRYFDGIDRNSNGNKNYTKTSNNSHGHYPQSRNGRINHYGQQSMKYGPVYSKEESGTKSLDNSMNFNHTRAHVQNHTKSHSNDSTNILNGPRFFTSDNYERTSMNYNNSHNQQVQSHVRPNEGLNLQTYFSPSTRQNVNLFSGHDYYNGNLSTQSQTNLPDKITPENDSRYITTPGNSRENFRHDSGAKLRSSSENHQRINSEEQFPHNTGRSHHPSFPFGFPLNQSPESFGEGNSSSSSRTTGAQSTLNIPYLLPNMVSGSTNGVPACYQNEILQQNSNEQKNFFQGVTQYPPIGQSVRSDINLEGYNYHDTSIDLKSIFDGGQVFGETKLFDGQHSQVPTKSIDLSTHDCISPNRSKYKVFSERTHLKNDADNAVDSNFHILNKNIEQQNAATEKNQPSD